MTDSVEKRTAPKQQSFASPTSQAKHPTQVNRRRVTKAVFGLPAVMTLHAGAALAQSSAVSCVVKGNFDPQGTPGGPFVNANPLSTTYTGNPPNVRIFPDTDPANNAWERRPVTIANYPVDIDNDPATAPVDIPLYTEDPSGLAGPFYQASNGQLVNAQVGAPSTATEQGSALFYVEVDADGNVSMDGLANQGMANPVSLSCYNSFTSI